MEPISFTVSPQMLNVTLIRAIDLDLGANLLQILELQLQKKLHCVTIQIPT
jgi:hypothetical protein